MKQSAVTNEMEVSFSAGTEGIRRGRLLRLSRHHVVFEVYGESRVLRISERLQDFQITNGVQVVYQGRAVTKAVVDTGAAAVYEVSLNESDWNDITLDTTPAFNGALAKQFRDFMDQWQKSYSVSPEFKLIIADMAAFFADLKHWVDQVDFALRDSGETKIREMEDTAARALAAPVLPCIDAMFERFEEVAVRIASDALPAHSSYMRRQLHPLVMCAPFAHRTFHKPLGYAGDYEMVNMIERNGLEGGSLYAKLINSWFLKQPPAIAHRNRIAYLTEQLRNECHRALAEGRVPHIYNLACGPAQEIQNFMDAQPVSGQAHLTLVDFNEDTLSFLKSRLDGLAARRGRRTRIEYIKRSVHQILKEAAHENSKSSGEYDLVYCAGLFDYLSDQVCRRITSLMYSWLKPGGLLIATNVEPRNPLRNGMEHLLDWHLIYRDARQMYSVRPEEAPEDACRVHSETTGVNVFLEVRKPAHE